MKTIQAIILFFSFLLISCRQTPPPPMSFYYWKTTFDLKPIEQQALEENNVQKLYVRYFDVAFSPEGKPYPVSQVQYKNIPKNIEIVPVVFIRNEVMLHPTIDIDSLAHRIHDHINAINISHQLPCTEIQIDCDWSLKSRENFMAFIDRLKRITDKQLSATIRLHQIKYAQKTKIPNVDYGVLMYYNMGEINAEESSSIYNKTIADLYTHALQDYPLPLKAALPIFSWGVHLRNDHVVGLKSKLTTGEIQIDTNFHAIKPGFFEAKRNVLRKGTYYRKGDVLKIEAINKGNLLEMAEDLKKQTHFREVIFYDLDSLNLKNYEKDIFAQIRAAFKW